MKTALSILVALALGMLFGAGWLAGMTLLRVLVARGTAKLMARAAASAAGLPAAAASPASEDDWAPQVGAAVTAIRANGGLISRGDYNQN